MSTAIVGTDVRRKSMAPWLKDDVEYYPHQAEAIRHLINKANFLLCDDMGLGKSLEAITIFCADILRGMAETCLVVCPVTIKENWADEFEKFTTVPAVILQGTPAQRSEKLISFRNQTGPRALIVNYEQVTAHLGELNLVRFDVAIFDEAHYIKNHKSKRTKAALDIRAHRYFMLTGTPILNNVSELWSLLHKCDPAKFRSYWTFVNRYCVFGGFQNKQIIGVKHEEELKNILTQYMIRRLSKDVLPLKEPIPQIKYVNLAEEQRKIYNQVRDELILVDEATGKEQDIDNALTKFLRLKQICGSTYSFTGTDVSSKLDVACEDAVQIVLGQNDRLIVFTQFRDTQHVYAQRLRKEGILVWELHGDIKQEERVGIVKEWALSKRPGVILCMLQVAGTGLNMTAARYIQFLDKLYVPGLNQQAIARANRIGQDITQAVIVMEYICRDTVESRIEAILRGKIKTVDNIVEGAAEWKRSFLEKLKEEMARERVGL